MIRVNVQEKLKVAPDKVEFDICLTGRSADYAGAVKEVSSKLDILTADLAGVGVAAEEIKTEDLEVGERYEDRAENGTHTREVCGYECVDSLSLRVENEPAIVDKVLNVLLGSKAEVKLEVRYVLDNAQPYTDQLLTTAMAHAKHKAEIIAMATGKSLGEVVDVEYNISPRNLYSATQYPAGRLLGANGCSVNMNIHPSGVEIGESVVVTFDIK